MDLRSMSEAMTSLVTTSSTLLAVAVEVVTEVGSLVMDVQPARVVVEQIIVPGTRPVDTSRGTGWSSWCGQWWAWWFLSVGEPRVRASNGHGVGTRPVPCLESGL